MAPTREKRSEWRRRAAAKNAVVPAYFEVTPHTVYLLCGACRRAFQRNLIPNVNDPIFVCPAETCRSRNWVPITYKLQGD